MGSFLVFNFDGTGNEPEDANQEVKYKDKKEDDNISNILKLHLMMGGNLFKSGEHHGESQLEAIKHCFYYQGIGTYGSRLNRLLNQGLALEKSDVATIINQAKDDFRAKYQPGDVVLITGFSRGAALARRFVSIIANPANELISEGTEPFVFLCVFDTVASIGLPNLSTASRPDYDVVFEDGCTLSSIVKKATHMVSLDEKRRSFQPTLMNHEPDKIIELWFSGAHSDIGGGYYRDGLSDITLSYAMKWLEYMGRVDKLPVLQLSMPNQESINRACPKHLKGVIGVDDLQRNPNPMGKNHQQDRWPVIDWITLASRNCCVIENDKIHPTKRPTIHYCVTERLHRDDDYRPQSLINKRHSVWYDFINPVKDCDNYNTHIHYADVNWNQLKLNDSIERVIEADLFYNHTGIIVEGDETYKISVFDGDQWHDGKDISCDGNGWNCDDLNLGMVEFPIRMMKKLRRVPDADWFTLCATVNSNDDHAQSVAQNGEYKTRINGELLFFANDLKSKYGNNSGSLRITIKRIE